jgi:hypothetical protein
MNGATSLTYGGKQMRVRRGAICLIALFVASPNQESNQERGASKHLAPGTPYTYLLTSLAAHTFRAYDSLAETRGQACSASPDHTRRSSRQSAGGKDVTFGTIGRRKERTLWHTA